jgi:hypothetical protein
MVRIHEGQPKRDLEIFSAGIRWRPPPEEVRDCNRSRRERAQNPPGSSGEGVTRPAKNTPRSAAIPKMKLLR